MTVTSDRIPLAKGDDHVYAENHSVETTPAGIECYYQPQPRAYKLRRVDPKVTKWAEVPSVTAVLGCLEKGGLSWWGMKVGIEGVVELIRRDIFGVDMLGNPTKVADGNFLELRDVDAIVDLLKEHKLTVNHTLSKAGDRGTNVHSALEAWAVTGDLPNPEDFPVEECGYVVGLRAFLEHSKVQPEAFEVMVGSLKHGFAGRYDLRGRLEQPAVVIGKCYPKKAPKWVEIPAGSYLLDLKTSKGVYPKSHFRQLEAYELASVECGYEPTDYRAVLHVQADGQYELKRSTATAKQFLRVLDVYRDDQELG